MKASFIFLCMMIMFFGIAGCPKNESATGVVETSIVKNPVTSPNSSSVPIDNSIPFPETSLDTVGTSSIVPEPATLLLFGSGLVGIPAFERRKFKR